MSGAPDFFYFTTRYARPNRNSSSVSFERVAIGENPSPRVDSLATDGVGQKFARPKATIDSITAVAASHIDGSAADVDAALMGCFGLRDANLTSFAASDLGDAQRRNAKNMAAQAS